MTLYRLFRIIVIFFFTIAALPAVYAEDGFKQVQRPCGLSFPKDFAPHEGFRTEWWYYTGNLESKNGQQLGYQFTIFRRQLLPKIRMPETGPVSPWRTVNLYMAHASVSDFTKGVYHKDERLTRDAPGLAGFSKAESTVTVYILDWKTELGMDIHRLTAESGDFSYSLDLTPEKPPVFHGDGGYSVKGDSPDNASCYYSFTRLKTKGKMVLNGQTFTVSGTSWMDHEFSSSFLEKGAVGWDWFSLQFNDGSEMMLFMIRKKGDGAKPSIQGTYVPADPDENGKGVPVSGNAVAVTVTDSWKSPDSGAVYPSGWRIMAKENSGIPKLDIMVKAKMNNQEMRAMESAGVIYWEGGVAVTGTKDGKIATGAGYVELTGYASSFDAPM